MALALRTLDANGGGVLVVSGHEGEAERLRALARNAHVVVEPTARTTLENVERSLPYLEHATHLTIASDWFHARRAGTYLRKLRPDLGQRLVRPERRWIRGWWMELAGAGYAAVLAAQRTLRPRR